MRLELLTYIIFLSFALIALSPLSAGAAGPVITNPLDNVQTFGDLIKRVLQGFLTFVSILAVIAIIIGGVRYITGVGREEEVARAKKIILWAIIGLIVVGLSAIIVNVVLWAVGVRP